MFNEREFIRRVEASGIDELAQVLARPTVQQERALRVHLGDERYHRMHVLALQQAGLSRDFPSIAPRQGNVVVIHGIMGSELSSFNSPGSADLIWVNKWRILRGWTEHLLLNDDGKAGKYQVRATGMITDYYGELLLKLRSQRWDTRPFWFDWRLDLRTSADQLHASIAEWFGEDSPVHIVAHSMGGLVARTFIARHPERWKRMWDGKAEGRAGGRLVMLGTPNYGSFVIPQLITGLEPVVRMLALLDVAHGLRGLLKIVNTFPGSYQMLPSPFVMRNVEPLYRSETYGEFSVPQRHLNNARSHHERLQQVVDVERMIYVAGNNRPTFSGVRDFSRLNSPAAYEVTKLGDGRVTHDLGILRKDGRRVGPVYYIDEDHGELPRNQNILSVIGSLLSEGSTDGLATEVASGVYSARSRASKGGEDLRRELVAEQNARVQSFQEAVARLGLSRSAEPPALLSGEERTVREGLTGGAIHQRSKRMRDRSGMTMKQERLRKPVPVEIRVVWSGIEEVDPVSAGRKARLRRDDPAVDAIAVGHYLGVGRPLAAEQALDQAISRALLKKGGGKNVQETEGLLTLYAERGVIRGELGQPFFLTDPRTEDGRLIAIAGMGVPGHFGSPELTVLARELCWSLGRLGKRHLATVLIGAGKGNLTEAEAVFAWVRGLRYALTGSAFDEGWRLKRLTFVEIDPRKIEALQEAVMAARERENKADPNSNEVRLEINYKELDLQGLTNTRGQTLRDAINSWARSERHEQPSKDKKRSSIPTRITLAMQGRKYNFGAITESASVPERDVPLDPKLVMEANDRLTVMPELEDQLDWGRYLGRLLVPDDLRAAFTTDAPVIMTLDASTARIHWEVIALPENNPTPAGRAKGEVRDSPCDYFLGTSRGFTRQLRTGFAPLPEPPPPPRRTLRVLVVADPAEDAPLPGAEREGREIAQLFRAFNEVYGLKDYQVEAFTLFGPAEATRTDVLYQLTRRGPYDILHFAGHCMYDMDDPASSGWIFSGGDRLSANELNRIDQVPKFVFSNACESGITPDRAEARTAALAPSFAEAFFARGVANFVCTAWPVNDLAALDFARHLYCQLLGLKWDSSTPRYIANEEGPQPMHIAMREARNSVACSASGTRTWGAYQHYGNPYLQFFDPQTLKAAASKRTQSSDKPNRQKTKAGQPR